MTLRRVLPRALLEEDKVEIAGKRDDKLPEDFVYVSPTTRKVIDGRRGDTVKDLPPDAVEVDRTTYWDWYQEPKGIQILKLHYKEVKKYFPELELFQDENQNLVWSGKVSGTEIVVCYPKDYPEAKLTVILPNELETANQQINQSVQQECSPAQAVIHAIKFLLAKEDAVVQDEEGKEEA